MKVQDPPESHFNILYQTMEETNKQLQTISTPSEVQVIKAKEAAEFALTPVGQMVRQFEATQRMAKMYAVSTFIPDSYKYKNGKPLAPDAVLANCTIALEMAVRMQANPLMVMQNLYIVHGQPAFSSKFLISCINASKRFSPLRYEFNDKEGDDYGCRVVAYEAADIKHKDPLVGDWITIGMARKEGWLGKNGSKWQTMPGQMLRYRAAAFWQRAYCPEISMGLITSEEAYEVQDAEYTEISTSRESAPTDLASIAAKNAMKAVAAKKPEAEAAVAAEEEPQTEQASADNVVDPFDNNNAQQPEQAPQSRPSLL